MRSASSRRITIAVFISALTMAGCGDPTTPLEIEDVVGMYVLQRVGNEPIPAVVHVDNGETITILADTIHLRADHRGSRSGAEQREDSEDPERNTVWQIGGDIVFEIVRDRIEIHVLCPINALCAAGPHVIAYRTPSGLRAQRPGRDDPGPFHYSSTALTP